LAGGLRRTHFRFAIQKIQNFRGREAAVEAHPDFRLGKGVDT
jgi:transketolase